MPRLFTSANHIGDTVFEVGPITHCRVDTNIGTTLPVTNLTAFPGVALDDHIQELVTRTHSGVTHALPGCGPDLIGGIVTMDNTVFVTTLSF